MDAIEAEMKSILEKRSIAFWLHLYRRLGVSLAPTHESLTDPRTIGLVRNITELAIMKFGRLLLDGDLALSSQIHLDKILGGVLRKAIKNAYPTRFYAMYRSYGRMLRASPAQWVLKNFHEDDFIAIYFMEGLSYQYWRITALLRVLGKGADVTFDDSGNWNYLISDEFNGLLRSIDLRTEEDTFDSSLIGVWFTNSVPKESSTRQVIISPQYNVQKNQLRDLFATFGIELPPEFITNFVPAILDIRVYLEAHQTFSDAVMRRHGFHLATLVNAIWALAMSFMLTKQIAQERVEAEQRRRFGEHLLNICQRGYRIMGIGDDAEKEVAIILAAAGEGFWMPPDEEELERAVQFLRLSQESQNSISLWSGGPRHLLVPMHSEHIIVDLHPIAAILRTLFFRTQHDQGLRGTLFEEEFRRSIKAIGLDCVSGVLNPRAGTPRELDAGVETNGQLFVFECVSVELPLDYEIGKPDTLARRRERLEEKIDQVLTLVDFIRSNPSGRNYSFNNQDALRPFVVSPFCEWIWERSPRLWESDDVPRILSGREAIELLKSNTAKQQS